MISDITDWQKLKEANILIADTYRTLEFLVAVALMYYVLNNVIGALGIYLEKRFRTGGELQ